MMKFNLLSVLCLGLFSFNQVSAQRFKDRSELSVGPEFAFPIGNFNDVSTFGFGGTAKYSYHFDDRFAVSLQSGWIKFNNSNYSNGYYHGDGNSNFAAIPIKVGGRYSFSRFYVEPQIGFTYFSNESAYQNRSTTFALNTGVYINKFLTADVRWERWNRGGYGASLIGARVAYWFRFSNKKDYNHWK
ncbi:outer membrane beta-barrel protein [Rhizosphaericola mali]|uniref:Autotransporter outer membrane beta-barrel domain-containing protein n=1 Tax=Rhizosphaericola mali TaxID=2545455 RepID=A0A5P2G8S4_9BACT|nr:outer membrane beta-barrel protein [Rhizosphaericola mali]QES89613.1 autotransporter outer membrane beta-barrel domain-containing protein [Rhizosphaericola mali]